MYQRAWLCAFSRKGHNTKPLVFLSIWFNNVHFRQEILIFLIFFNFFFKKSTGIEQIFKQNFSRTRREFLIDHDIHLIKHFTFWNILSQPLVFFSLLFEVRCELHHLHYLKNVKNTHGGVFNTPPWVFLTFFKLYKWYQIAQHITYVQIQK